jgi:hypothetical protein
MRWLLRLIIAIGLVSAAAALDFPERSNAARSAPAAATSSAPPSAARPAPAAVSPIGAAPSTLSPAPPVDRRDAPDPFVLDAGNLWVVYTTQVGLLNVPVATSRDLATWSDSTDALPVLPRWAEWGHTWAPGVVERAGSYVLYFAARDHASGRQCIGSAVSTSPTGPFTSPAPEPLVCQAELGGAIDPHPFVDADGTAYLYWKADGNAIGRTSIVFGQRLRSDGLGFVGEPVALLHNDAAWERPLIENPAVVRLPDVYVLLYSGGWWESAGYATGYATCDAPLGPCAKVTVDRPLLGSTEEAAGPGGATVIAGPSGDRWLAYHAWDPDAVGYANGGARSLRFAPLESNGSELAVSSR